MQALGIVELNSIASGIETADAMLKAAQVELVTAQAICAGKYMILLQGDVAAMKSALQAGEEIAGSHLVNLQMIANLTRVFHSFDGCRRSGGWTSSGCD